MKYLHTMIRISNVEKSLNFYCNELGLIETRRIEILQESTLEIKEPWASMENTGSW